MAPTWSPQHDGGFSAVEYGLLLAGVVAMIVVVIGALGGATAIRFDHGCAPVSHGVTSEVHDEVSGSTSC